MKQTTVVVPITNKNRQGMDDILDAVKTMLDENIQIVEGYVITTDNPGALAVCIALRDKAAPVPVGSNNGQTGRKNGRPKKAELCEKVMEGESHDGR
jgi:hypothetical protein